MKSPEGGENKGKKTISGRRNEDTPPQYHGVYTIQRDSIPKIGTKISKRKMIGKHQISGRKSHRWCFIKESWRFIPYETELSQVSVLNTKGAVVVHLRNRYEISNVEKAEPQTQPLMLDRQRRLAS